MNYARRKSFRAELLLFVGLTVITACMAQEPVLPSAALLQEIKTHGARKVVERLRAEVEIPGGVEGFKQVATPLWNQAIEQIETGDPRWLEVAQALKSGTDAGSSMELQIAVSVALPKAPAEVLSMLGTDYRGFRLEEICSGILIEPPPGLQESLLQRSEAALLALRIPELEDKRRMCLKYVQESRK